MFDGWSMLWVSIKLRRRAHKRREAFEAALRETPEVIEAHSVAGRFDYILKIALPSVSAWDALRERLDPENGFIKSVDVAPTHTAKEKEPASFALFTRTKLGRTKAVRALASRARSARVFVQLATRANFIAHAPCKRRCAETPQTVNRVHAKHPTCQ